MSVAEGARGGGGGADGSGSLDEIPSDTEAALLALFAELPPGAARVASSWQLYTLVRDRTVVDRELMEKFARGELRLFKLVHADDDFAIMNERDVLASLERAQPSAASHNALPYTLAKTLLSDHRDTSITKQEIVNTLDRISPDASSELSLPFRANSTHEAKRRRTSEPLLSQLVRLGFLLLRDSESFWITCPPAKTFGASLSAGNKEIISIIQRSKFHEILSKQLQNRKFRSVSLPLRLHLRDLEGGGFLTRQETTGGYLYRIANP